MLHYSIQGNYCFQLKYIYTLYQHTINFAIQSCSVFTYKTPLYYVRLQFVFKINIQKCLSRILRKILQLQFLCDFFQNYSKRNRIIVKIQPSEPKQIYKKKILKKALFSKPFFPYLKILIAQFTSHCCHEYHDSSLVPAHFRQQLLV